MKPIRRLAGIFWLALVLLVGQQAAALHDLGHATGQLTHKQDSNKAPISCDQCFACAELSGAVGASVSALPVVPASAPRAGVLHTPAAASPALLAYRSRAPPASLL